MTLSAPTILATSVPAASSAVTTAVPVTFAPHANALVITVSFSTGSTASNGQGTIGSTHGDLTWTVGGVTGGGNTNAAVRWWWAQAPAAPALGTVTVTSGGSPTIHDVVVFEVTGHDTASPIYATATATDTAAATLSSTLSSTPAVTDMVIGLVVNRNKSTAPTPGSGFTAAKSAATTSPSASYLIEYRTASASTTVDAGNVGTQWSGLQGFVIKAAAAGTATVRKYGGRLTSTAGTNGTPTAADPFAVDASVPATIDGEILTSWGGFGAVTHAGTLISYNCWPGGQLWTVNAMPYMWRAVEVNDLIWSSGATPATVDTFVVNHPTFPCNVQLALTVVTGTGQNITVSYTNQDGVAGRTASSRSAAAPILPADIRRMQLEGSDSSVQSVQSITATVGAQMRVVAYRRLFSFSPQAYQMAGAESPPALLQVATPIRAGAVLVPWFSTAAPAAFTDVYYEYDVKS